MTDPTYGEFWARRRTDPRFQTPEYRRFTASSDYDLLVADQLDEFLGLGRHEQGDSRTEVFCRRCGPGAPTGVGYLPVPAEGTWSGGPVFVGSIRYNVATDPRADLSGDDVKMMGRHPGSGLYIVVLIHPTTPTFLPVHCGRCGPATVPRATLLTALANNKRRIGLKHSAAW